MASPTDYLLALDQGTSSSRSIVFDRGGRIVAMAQRELPQIYPQPGWVEHDPMEIWRGQLATARDALAKAGLKAADVRAIGITNQRETTVLWNRRTGQPVHHAIVWQDRRAEPLCAELRGRGMQDVIQRKTGLVIDAYFSATKLRWLLDEVPGLRAQAEAGELAFGTVDSWLIWQLTGGRVHATDVTNASRTMLFDVHRNAWDDELLGALDIPAALLPQVQPSSSFFGETDAALLGAAVPIGGVAGDQQAALFGQACFDAGMAKNTYGTGCFLLMHTGERFQPSTNGLVVTSAAQLAARAVGNGAALLTTPLANGVAAPQGTDIQHGFHARAPAPGDAAAAVAAAQYAMEGSVFVGGAVVQWLRDGLRAIKGSAEVQALAESVPDAGGVMMVPAFTGLGAPYWNADARGTITGLTRGTTVAHIARAALESIAYQSAALLAAMSRDVEAAGGTPVAELRVDGGACVNDLLMQFQADLLGIPVVRPAVVETTALGAAFLAGLSSGVYAGTDELSALWKAERRFLPTLSRAQAEAAMARWEHAVRQATAG
ncbi:glycerol kinase GlpK [Pseudacidovorax sp. NFM-22]|uniref:glycerol kinase GlpK n=1 Tax=Pseudacidovorax sp. NFM-22 TaxID=2744469 RepID=UPI001F3F8EBF|nr:glycerol kinase GlpK [Pseudacidovorax sp. NFM-22]